jgi:hypothetical protein
MSAIFDEKVGIVSEPEKYTKPWVSHEATPQNTRA